MGRRAGRGRFGHERHIATRWHPRRPAALRRRRLAIEPLEARLVLSSHPIISELLANNDQGLTDRFGDHSDWLEIFNPDPQQAVDLTGWKLKYGNSTTWAFPSMTLGPGEFRVIFATKEDIKDPNDELHTNFNLDKEGKYLALLDNANNVVQSWNPYPVQSEDVSYGVGQSLSETKLIAGGATASYCVPVGGSFGLDWTQPGFLEDASWTGNVATGIGFAEAIPGWAANVYKAAPAMGNIANLTTAQTVVDHPAFQSWDRHETTPVINYTNTGGGGRFAIGSNPAYADRTIPNMSINSNQDNYVIRATGKVHIPASTGANAGKWTFGVSSDEGFRLQIAGATYVSGVNVTAGSGGDHMEYDGTRAAAESFGTFQFPAGGGDFDVTLLYFDGTGNSEVEVFASNTVGAKIVFDTTFRLVGDTANGGFQVLSYPFEGDTSGGLLATAVHTDVRSAMGASAVLDARIPFDTPEQALATLTLKMQYDDAYIAYLNGVEVASRNLAVAKTIGTMSRSGSTVAVTLTGHGFVNGDTIHVAGAVPSDFNGDFVISERRHEQLHVHRGGRPRGGVRHDDRPADDALGRASQRRPVHHVRERRSHRLAKPALVAAGGGRSGQRRRGHRHAGRSRLLDGRDDPHRRRRPAGAQRQLHHHQHGRGYLHLYGRRHAGRGHGQHHRLPEEHPCRPGRELLDRGPGRGQPQPQRFDRHGGACQSRFRHRGRYPHQRGQRSRVQRRLRDHRGR